VRAQRRRTAKVMGNHVRSINALILQESR
jgi:hypothetical protein